MTQPLALYVGLEIGQPRLDVAVGKTGDAWATRNDAAGIAELVARLMALKPALIVLEATGGLERPLLEAFAQAHLPWALVQPARVRDFAHAMGQLAKTDPLDARVLAHFAEALQPLVTQMPTEAEQTLNALVGRRRQLLDMVVAEKNHLTSAPGSQRASIETHLAWLATQLETLEQALQVQTAQTPAFHAKAPIQRSAKGVGPVLCAKLLSGLPELGQLDRHAIAARVGVAPYNDDSSHRRGKRRLKGGRADVRAVLYMATLSARRFNPVIQQFYQHLRAQGKLYQVAMGACMCKFLTILNAMLREMRPFQTPTVSVAP